MDLNVPNAWAMRHVCPLYAKNKFAIPSKNNEDIMSAGWLVLRAYLSLMDFALIDSFYERDV